MIRHVEVNLFVIDRLAAYLHISLLHTTSVSALIFDISFFTIFSSVIFHKTCRRMTISITKTNVPATKAQKNSGVLLCPNKLVIEAIEASTAFAKVIYIACLSKIDLVSIAYLIRIVRTEN